MKKGIIMIYSTKEFNVKTSVARIAAAGHTFSLAAVAADIRHNYTNYDAKSNLLGTDQAEELIIATYKAVVSINSATAPAMKAWAKSKLNTLA